MKKLSEFLLSLLALPFLLAWQMSERIFEFAFQPLIYRRFKIAIDPRKVLALKIAFGAVGLAVLAFLAYRAIFFWDLYPSAREAFFNIKVYFILVLNDAIRVAQKLLWPVNTLIVFVHGGQIKPVPLFLALYLCFLPLLFIFHLVFRSLRISRALSQAVALRNRAVQDVNIVHFAEQAKPDQIFLGLDLTRGGTPFYVQRQALKGHAQIIGSSGTGKTESIIHPIWFQEMRRNVATFALDGKGSRRNIEKIYTIASSMAQGQEVKYFNPADVENSATYNPVLRGSAAQIRQKIIASLDWSDTPPGEKERTSYYLDLIIRAIQEGGRFVSLDEIFQYLSSKTHLHDRLRQMHKRELYEGLFAALENFPKFQSETELLTTMLREICQAEYAWLLDTDEPEIDIFEDYQTRKDCYFTLPLQGNAPAMRFVGQLILQDLISSFAQAAMAAGSGEESNEGLLIVDELSKFASPSFIELLRVCGNAGVSVVYTNQSFAELANPALKLHASFTDELVGQTNALFCFQLGSEESARLVMQRMGLAAVPKSKAEDTKDTKKSASVDTEFLKNLEVGRCVLFMRQPRTQAVLKTGYFKFDQPLPFRRQEKSRQTVAAAEV
ncbi:MAG: type IV secretory system conjugative DNA transfer family protein [bacterium]